MPLEAMGHPPAYIFVTRHGTRLDSVDEKWQLTSPTPYDPPLSNGGWQQAKAVGARIADILAGLAHDRLSPSLARGSSSPLSQPASSYSDGDSMGRETERDASHGQPARNYRIVIHSSPYRRCVQTSIGICAGLAQAVPQGQRVASGILPVTGRGRLHRALLRIDSFLGEWLTPDYFEFIAPPPAGGVMLQKAKADLLRRSNFDLNTRPSAPGRQHLVISPTPLNNGTLSVSLPSKLAENDSDSVLNLGLGVSHSQHSPAREHQADWTYVPPTPLYTPTHHGKIPEGLVDHARDACAAIDYQWNSSEEPLAFGDSGTFEEEWAVMHRRFRKGLQSLVDWYAATPEAAEPFSISTSLVSSASSVPGTDLGSFNAEDLIEFEDECHTETVIVFVSHGAGCNAMIGALTNQPALIDISTASLTMAVRRPTPLSPEVLQTSVDMPGASFNPNPKVQRPSLPLHRFYEVKIVAQTDHLRPGAVLLSGANFHLNSSRGATWEVPTSSHSRHSRSGSPAPVIGSFRYGELASSLNGPSRHSFSNPPLTSLSTSAVSGHRRLSSGSAGPRMPIFHSTSIYSPSNPTSLNGPGTTPPKATGLWSPAVTSSLRLSADDLEDDPNDIFPDFDHKMKFSNQPLVSPVVQRSRDGSSYRRQSFDSGRPSLPSVDESISSQPELERTRAGRSAPIKIRSSSSVPPSSLANTSGSQRGSGAGGSGEVFPLKKELHGDGPSPIGPSQPR